MAKRNQKSTEELIINKQDEITSQKELLAKLELELQELKVIKEQEEKDELFNLAKNTGLTFDEIKRFINKVAENEQSKKNQNVTQKVVPQNRGSEIEVKDEIAKQGVKLVDKVS